MRGKPSSCCVDTYLDIAHDVAAGDGESCHSSKRLRGQRNCDAMMQQDGADEGLRLQVLRESMAAHANVDEVDKEANAVMRFGSVKA